MQPSPTLISVEEYLNTSYSPDCDYVDGVVLERNLGESDHSRAQRKTIGFFIRLEETLGTYAYPEQRVQVKPTRFRIPDVCVVLGGEWEEPIFRRPPFLAIEIVSRDDRARDLQVRVDDYLAFGVPYVWVIDPRTRKGHVHTREGAFPALDGVLWTRNPDIQMPLSAVI